MSFCPTGNNAKMYRVTVHKPNYSHWILKNTYYFESLEEGIRACKQLYRQNTKNKVILYNGEDMQCSWESEKLSLYFSSKYNDIMSFIVQSAIDLTDYRGSSTSILVDNADGVLSLGDTSGRLKPIPVHMTEDLFNKLCEVENFVKSRGFEGIDNILFSPRNPKKCRTLLMTPSKNTPGLATILYNL